MIYLGKNITQLYNSKVYISGKRIEIYRYNSYQAIGKEGNNKEGRTGKGTGCSKEKNRKVTLNRARNNIIRLANSNPDLTTFITLTYKENFKDLKKSKSHLNYFFKKLMKYYKGLKYLYVLEFQERGAIHYHLLCNLSIEFKTSHRGRKSQIQREYEKWFAKAFWSNRGFVDIRNLESEGNDNAGKYIATYLVEDLIGLDLQGNKCFGYSRNLEKPRIELLDTDEGIEEIVKIYKNYKVTYTSTYEIVYVDSNGNERKSSVDYIDLYYKGE